MFGRLGPRQGLPLEEPRPAFVRDLRAQLIRQATAANTANTATAAAAPSADTEADSGGGQVIPLPSAGAHLPGGHKVVHARPVSHRGRRRLGAAAASLVIGSGSLGFLTAQALPEDTPGAAALRDAGVQPGRTGAGTDAPTDRAGAAHLHRARAHLHQAAGQTNDAMLVGHALKGFSRQARRGADLLLDGRGPGVFDAGSTTPLSGFVRDSTRTLTRIAGTIPGSAKDSYTTATETLHRLTSRARQRRDTPLPNTGGPTTRHLLTAGPAGHAQRGQLTPRTQVEHQSSGTAADPVQPGSRVARGPAPDGEPGLSRRTVRRVVLPPPRAGDQQERGPQGRGGPPAHASDENHQKSRSGTKSQAGGKERGRGSGSHPRAKSR